MLVLPPGTTLQPWGRLPSGNESRWCSPAACTSLIRVLGLWHHRRMQ